MSIETLFRTDVIVSGMTCGHCTASVREEVGELAGVRDVEVDLSTGLVTISSDRELPLDEIRGAVTEAGYTLAD
ncbi:heavy-metal-associated domain-containing protein [Pseudonocardia benzenivorans]